MGWAVELGRLEGDGFLLTTDLRPGPRKSVRSREGCTSY